VLTSILYSPQLALEEEYHAKFYAHNSAEFEGFWANLLDECLRPADKAHFLSLFNVTPRECIVSGRIVTNRLQFAFRVADTLPVSEKHVFLYGRDPWCAYWLLV
jgi:hypothetical protein